MTRERKFSQQPERFLGRGTFKRDCGFVFSDDIEVWQKAKVKKSNDERGKK